MAKYKVYAVLNGRKTGLFSSYEECKEQITGYKKAVFKGFESEAEAKEWLENGGNEKKRMSAKLLRQLAAEAEL